MDREIREYLDQKLLGMATKDDVEKLRQEGKANFRQLKEDIKGQILEWEKESKLDLEQLKKEVKEEISPILGEIKEDLRKARTDHQSVTDLSNQKLESSLQSVKEDTKTAMDQWQHQIGTTLQSIKEEGIVGVTRIVHLRQENKADLEQLREGVESLIEEIKQVTEEIGLFNGKIKEGFMEVKEELGSMIKFSYADLEKRFNALELRVKALEKMILP